MESNFSQPNRNLCTHKHEGRLGTKGNFNIVSDKIITQIPYYLILSCKRSAFQRIWPNGSQNS